LELTSGHFGKQIRNTCELLNCGAEEGRRSVGSIVCEMKKRSITWSQGEINIPHIMNRRKDNWIVHMLCGNCLLKHVIEGKLRGTIQVTGRRGTRRKQILNDNKDI